MLLLGSPALAQTEAPTIRWKPATSAGADATGRVLTLQRFYERIADTHPLIRQAVLYRSLARARLMEARGAFDPKVAYSYANKRLDERPYYTINELKGVVPLRAGLNLTGGVERNGGYYVNPQYDTQGKNLLFGGIELQALQGFMLDDRRAGILQAKAGIRLAESQVLSYANKVLAVAAKDYWDFFFAFHQANFLLEGVELAATRYEGVRLQFRVGEEAAIDTVEAEILLQDRSNQYLEAWNALRNSRLQLQSHLWGPPLEADPADSLTFPEPFILQDIPLVGPDPQQGQDQIIQANPDLINSRVQLQQLDIDRRLALQGLLPVANLKYQILNKPATNDFAAEGVYFRNNYRFGAEVSVPIFLRKERGKLAQIRIKTEQARLDLQQAQRDAEIAYRQYRNDLTTYRTQIGTQTRMVANYRVLRDGEAIKFGLGESSLFLVNTRESKLIEAEIKLVNLQAKWQKSRTELLGLGGLLTETVRLPEVR